ncbi:hypothetical protein F4823DRAFT_146684 [Ustulina deusta]|nr:hypothetical protein F4823DRAFT_146684 [Ustulina deusta]
MPPPDRTSRAHTPKRNRTNRALTGRRPLTPRRCRTNKALALKRSATPQPRRIKKAAALAPENASRATVPAAFPSREELAWKFGAELDDIRAQRFSWTLEWRQKLLNDWMQYWERYSKWRKDVDGAISILKGSNVEDAYWLMGKLLDNANVYDIANFEIVVPSAFGQEAFRIVGCEDPRSKPPASPLLFPSDGISSYIRQQTYEEAQKSNHDDLPRTDLSRFFASTKPVHLDRVVFKLSIQGQVYQSSQSVRPLT